MLPLVTPLLAFTAQVPETPLNGLLEFTSAQAQFAVHLFRELDDAPGNLICSPFSLARALAMARAGAAGETAREMDEVLRLPPEAGTRFVALVRALEPPPVGRKEAQRTAYALELATSLWAPDSVPFETQFLQRLKDGFASEMHAVDFSRAEEARAAINGWTAERTHDRVREIIPAGLLNGNTRLVLVDTIHFLGAWDEPFKATNTKELPFSLDKKSTVAAPMMRRVDTRSYGESPLAQIVELPFERGAMSMVIVLPKKGHDLAEVVNAEDFATWTKPLVARQVDVSLPRFEFRSSYSLKEALEKLGMPLAFTPGRADFSAMAREPLMIGAVLQQAFVAVDENGAEAAAATAVVMVRSSAQMPTEKAIVFDANHPFLFFIRHRSTGALLFVGRVSDPTR